MKSGPEVELDRRGAALAVLTVALAALFMALFYIAPDLLARPLWQGGALTVAFLLGTLSLAVPVVVAWLIVRHDRAGGETFDTTHH